MNTGGFPGWPIYLTIFGWGDLRKVECLEIVQLLPPTPHPRQQRVCFWASGAHRPDFKARKPSPPQGRSSWGHPWAVAFSENPVLENKTSGGQGVPDVAASVLYVGVYGIYGLKKKI